MYVYGACLFYVCMWSVEMFVVKDSVFFKPWSVEVCCIFV